MKGCVERRKNGSVRILKNMQCLQLVEYSIEIWLSGLRDVLMRPREMPRVKGIGMCREKETGQLSDYRGICRWVERLKDREREWSGDNEIQRKRERERNRFGCQHVETMSFWSLSQRDLQGWVRGSERGEDGEKQRYRVRICIFSSGRRWS